MGDSETNGLAIIGDLASNVPSPVRTRFVKALSDLLGGLTAIPAAWVKRPAQAVEDVTAARSAASAILARGVAEAALNDPAVMEAAREIYLPTIVRKAANRVRVAQRAVEHVSASSTDGAEAAAPNDDWMNAFMRFAEDASSEELQDMFGRILAGQVVRPGSFSLSTLRAVAELDQATAQDFCEVWARSVGDAVDYGPDFQKGDWFVRWKGLAEIGLMAESHSVQYTPPFTPFTGNAALWTPMTTPAATLVVLFPASCTAVWEYIRFTRVGREIGSILPTPDYAANMREAAHRFAKKGVARVELLTAGKSGEVLYQAPLRV